ncbi:type II secretion system protein [Novosphingobium sp.]|uniref:PulJ/GspJ family protein n=1 Tax=Novosphingobium sp. TaxID=1874826 RepID=UPI001DB970A3|nr:type II secretion system protein [Novosphingobium sp.]MBX9664015.1 type II secretion system GspH family protein [Novosphingobium sp.]
MISAAARPQGAPRGPGEAGFSLIEMLIALAIVTAMTGALVGTVGQDARARLAVQQRREALLVAQSVLDQMADANAPLEGRWRGYGWRVLRQPYQLADPLDRHPLEQITVSVGAIGGVAGSKRGEIIRLSTVRIKP